MNCHFLFPLLLRLNCCYTTLRYIVYSDSYSFFIYVCALLNSIIGLAENGSWKNGLHKKAIATYSFQPLLQYKNLYLSAMPLHFVRPWIMPMIRCMHIWISWHCHPSCPSSIYELPTSLKELNPYLLFIHFAFMVFLLWHHRH